MNESLVVLICKDYLCNPNSENYILDVPEAVARLREDGLTLSIEDGARFWKIEDHSPLSFRKDVGASCQFSGGGLRGANYLVGVYDRTKTAHLSSMADSVRYKESKRHPGFDDGD